MSRYAAGKLDRRITVQIQKGGEDAAGDPILDKWEDEYRLWAARPKTTAGQEVYPSGSVLRQHDTTFYVRDGEKARRIAPETHRILYKGRIYEIVGILPGLERADLIQILTAARPDQRGDRGDVGVSDGA